MFLSTNNFFWRVQRRNEVLTRTRKWRALGRPESALIGVEYRANDDGRIQRPFVVCAADTAPWLFAGREGVRRRCDGLRRYRAASRPRLSVP